MCERRWRDFAFRRPGTLIPLEGFRMTALNYRIPRIPRDGSCRHATVLGARVGQRGFAPQQVGQFLPCRPVQDDRPYAGFRSGWRTP